MDIVVWEKKLIDILANVYIMHSIVCNIIKSYSLSVSLFVRMLSSRHGHVLINIKLFLSFGKCLQIYPLGVSVPKNKILPKPEVSHKKTENLGFRFRYSFQTYTPMLILIGETAARRITALYKPNVIFIRQVGVKHLE